MPNDSTLSADQAEKIVHFVEQTYWDVNRAPHIHDRDGDEIKGYEAANDEWRRRILNRVQEWASKP